MKIREENKPEAEERSEQHEDSRAAEAEETNKLEEAKGAELDSFVGEVIPAETIEHMLRGLDVAKSAEIISVITQAVSTTRSGPLPSPRELQEYDNAFPGMKDTIVGFTLEGMEMTKAEMNHRHEMEKQVVHSQLRRGRNGQNFGFILSLVCFLVVAFMVAMGNAREGAWLAGTVIVGLATVFVTGRFLGSSKPEED